jgi:histidine triad (HIT) family protein
MDCIFCKIIKGEIPCAKVYEDEKILAFLDIAPANKGHVLVVPKEHYANLLDVPEPIIDDVMRVVKKAARAMSSALGNKGFNVLVNNGREAGQLVPHVHFHVIPRFGNERMCLNWKPVKYKDKEIGEVSEKIKKFL